MSLPHPVCEYLGLRVKCTEVYEREVYIHTNLKYVSVTRFVRQGYNFDYLYTGLCSIF